LQPYKSGGGTGFLGPQTTLPPNTGQLAANNKLAQLTKFALPFAAVVLYTTQPA